MRLPRQLFIMSGSALVLAAIAMAGVSFSVGSDPSVHAVGEFTAQPTFDPCEDAIGNIGGDLMIAGDGRCTPTEETLPKSHTPTPKPTEEPKTEVPNTATSVPATNTPTGGAAGGGLRPPNTGTGGDGSAASMQWLLMAGGLLAAAAGLGSLGYGIRRK